MVKPKGKKPSRQATNSSKNFISDFEGFYTHFSHGRLHNVSDILKWEEISIIQKALTLVL